MSKLHRILFASLLLGLSALASHAQASELNSDVTRAADFTLLDQQGKAFNLHYHGQRPAVLLMSSVAGSEYALKSLTTLVGSVDPQASGVAFAVINPEPGVDRQALLEFANAHSIEQSVLQDDAGMVSATLGLRYAGETLLINPQRWEIVYRGTALDESGAAVHPDLAASLQSLIAGEVPAAQVTQMNTAEPLPEHAVPVDVSYSDTVAPMLMEKCISTSLAELQPAFWDMRIRPL
jgi:hypothetical protein